MADDKEQKKKVEETKKKVQAEIKSLAKKTKGPAKTMKDWMAELDELEAKKKPSDEDKKKMKELRKKMSDALKVCQKEATSTSKRLNKLLTTQIPDDKAALPVWQRGMEKWYVDILKREPGLPVGGGIRVNGSLSIKEKKGMVEISGKF